MSATIKELKEIIVDLKMDLIELSIPNGYCPYSYYAKRENPTKDCYSVGCDECKRIFLDNMRKDIAKEVDAL